MTGNKVEDEGAQAVSEMLQVMATLNLSCEEEGGKDGEQETGGWLIDRQ